MTVLTLSRPAASWDVSVVNIDLLAHAVDAYIAGVQNKILKLGPAAGYPPALPGGMPFPH